MTIGNDLPLVVIGSGGHGRVVMEAAKSAGIKVRGFLDDTKGISEIVNGLPIVGGTNLLEDASFIYLHSIIVAIGDQQARRSFSTHVIERGGSLATIIHPTCIVSESSRLDVGTVATAGAIVSANSSIGRFCILNTGCTIDHDVDLADGVQICPGAHLAGGVRCGDDAFVGIGAAIIPNVKIGSRAVVGAGAVVIQDVPPGTIVVGNPARPIRSMR
jgi:sugar O-acyltransferase (sialic acid O-acetyltransferase NeuD family)